MPFYYRAAPRHPLSLAISAILSTTLLSPQAHSTPLEEVVVTAQKREQGIQEVPIAITALDADTIRSRGLENVQDLLGQIPGVGGFTSPGSRGNTGLSIRGVSGGSPSNLSFDPVVAIYTDGVYIGKMIGVSLDVAEVERIEVLRGPQGTLYGRNATAGAVNYISRRPRGELGVRAIGSVGNYDFISLKINADTPSIGEVGTGLGKIAMNIGLQTRERDGFYDNDSTGEDFNDLNRQAWRFGVAWDIRDNLVIDYVYDGSELDETNNLDVVVGLNPLDAAGNVSRIAALQGTLVQARAWAATPGTDPRIGSRWIPSLERTIEVYQNVVSRGEGPRSSGGVDVSPRSESDGSGHALTLTWSGSNITFKSITGYRDNTTKAFGDIDNIDSTLDENGVGAYNDLAHLTLAQLYGASGGFDPGIPQLPLDAFWGAIDAAGGALHFSQNSQSDYDQFSQEFQLLGSAERLEYVLGLYYFDDEVKYKRTSTALVPLAPIGEKSYEMTTTAWAAFGQATWTPSWLDDRLSLTAGLRYTEEDKEVDWASAQMIGVLLPPSSAMTASDDESFDNVSGSLTVAFQVTDDVNTYLRYGTGYRSGGFNGEAFASEPIEEETIEQWEVGLKSDWWDGSMRINAALYTYTYDDLQVGVIDVSNGTPSSRTFNAGKAERWGAELELLVAPIDDLFLGLSYSHIDGDFEEYPDLCGTNKPTICFQGEDFAKRGTSPDNQLNFFADYVFARTSAGEISGYLNINWQDEWYEASAWPQVVNGDPVIYPHQVMGARTVVDARLSLEEIDVGSGSMRVTLWGKNLTDEEYPTYSINFGSSLGLITENYGDPLTWGIEVAYEY